MHSRLSFLLFLGLLTFVSASTFTIQKRSFKVERVPNDQFTGRNGPRALAKVYRKFGMPLPQGLKDALDAQKASKIAPRRGGRGGGRGGRPPGGRPGGRPGGGQGAPPQATPMPGQAGGNAPPANATGQSGSVTATPEENDVEFLSPVKIGGQTVNLDFDTGSSDLWVFNTQLAAAATKGHQVFDPTLSKSFSLLQGAQFSITYGDGSGAQGNVGTDVVDIGGATVKAQAVELATDVTQQFIDDQNNDGLLGLAFSSINTVQPQQQKTFFDNVMDSLAEPLFTADLRKNAVGAYEFGSVNAAKFTGDLTWAPVNNSQGFWQFSSESFAVDGGKAQKSTAGAQAIADTGTTLILADPTIVKGYYAGVKGAKNNAQAGGFVFPCNAAMPDLDLDIGGVYMARVSGDDINFAPLGDGSESHCVCCV